MSAGTGIGRDSLKTRRSLEASGQTYDYYSIDAAGQALGVDFARLPYSLKVLLENLLRFADGRTVKTDDIKALGHWLTERPRRSEARRAGEECVSTCRSRGSLYQ